MCRGGGGPSDVYLYVPHFLHWVSICIYTVLIRNEISLKYVNEGKVDRQ